MRAVVQRVLESSVSIEGQIVGKIDQGLMVLLGVSKDDTEADAEYMAEKIVHMRIFSDQNGKMNRSLPDIGGKMLVVSQFTLYGNCRKGRRPSFVEAAPPDDGNALYEYFVDQTRRKGVSVETGRFGEMMTVYLVNDGPVTLIVESR